MVVLSRPPRLELWVEPFQFAACILHAKAPLDLDLLGVSSLLPGLNLDPNVLLRFHALFQTLAR